MIAAVIGIGMLHVIVLAGVGKQLTDAITKLELTVLRLCEIQMQGVQVSIQSARVSEEMARVVVRTEQDAVARVYGPAKKH